MSVAAVACTTLSAKTGWDGRELLLSYEAMVVLSERSSCSFIADLKPRIPSPIPLPSSGSFLGPNTSKAIPKITNRCVGCKSPSNINLSLILKSQNIAVCELQPPACCGQQHL